MANINNLQAKDFAKWVRKQVRQFGRKAEVANIQYSAVEMWLQELGFANVTFIAGGEVEVNGETLYTEWASCCYYMFNEEGLMETAAGRWLEIVNLEQPESYLIAR